MIKWVGLIFLCVFSSLDGMESSLEIRFLQSIANGVPGKIVPLQVEVTNRSPIARILVAHLDLPPLWNTIPCNDMLLHIEPGQSSIQTVMIGVPENALAGHYAINYEVWARDNQSIMNRDKTAIVIGESCREDLVTLELTSEILMEGAPDEVIYLTALVANHSDQLIDVPLRAVTPDGWLCIPQSSSVLSLEAKEHKAVIYGIKIPPKACAGEYSLTLTLDGCYFSQKKIIVKILPHINILAKVEGIKEETYQLNQAVQFYINYCNSGNSALKVALQVESEPVCSVSYPKEPFEILPYENHEVPIIIAPKSTQPDYIQFILIRLVDAETGEQLYQNPMTFKFAASCINQEDSTVYIPSYVSLMTLGDRNQTVAAVEYAGSGLIDADKNRYVDFFFRLPTEKQRVIYNIDQVLYARMYDDEWDIYIGDTNYALSPLTQRYRYGRGLGVDRSWEKWAVGVHYTENTLNSSCSPKETCAYIEYNPTDFLSLAANYLHKVEKGIPTSNIVTLQAEVELACDVTAELEVGKNFLQESSHNNATAYRFATSARFFHDSWFSLEKVYSGADFFGYYNHLHLFSSSLDMPLAYSWRLNAGVNRFQQDFLPWEEEAGAIIPRQHQYTLNLIYRYDEDLSFTLNALWLRGEDMGLYPQYDFYQHWYGSSLFFSCGGFRCNAICSIGQQNDFLNHSITQKLQRYYGYICKDFSAQVTGSIFYEGGNTNYYDARPWRNSYGGTFAYRFAPSGFFEICLQKVQQPSDMLELSQISGNFNYTFSNLHQLQATIQHYHYRCHYANDTMFLVSYKVPFSTPFGQRQDVGDLCGVLYNCTDQTFVCNADLSCGGKKTTSDEAGCFAFPCLNKGEHLPVVTHLPNHLMMMDTEELCVRVPGGKKTWLYLPVTTACSLSGNLTEYHYKDLFAILTDSSYAEFEKGEDLAGIRLAISNTKTGEIYPGITDEKGAFFFHKLRPGQWHIHIYQEGLPLLHELEMNDLILDIQPAEHKEILFKVRSSAPKMYKLE